MRASGAVCGVACERVGDGRGSRGRGGRSGRPATGLPGLRATAGAVGLRARARGPDARRRSLAQAAPSVLPRVRAAHVLLPAWSVARRRDAAEVIGQALLAKAQGDGHRRIAARLGRAPGTVRGWLRAFARGAETVGSCAWRWAHAVDVGSCGTHRPTGSPLADAVDALGRMHRACRLRLRTRAGPSESPSRSLACCTANRATRPGSSRAPSLPRRSMPPAPDGGAVTERSEGKGSEATLTAPPPAPLSPPSGEGGRSPRRASATLERPDPFGRWVVRLPDHHRR